MRGRRAGLAALGAALAVAASPANAQAPLPPLPPLGGQPPVQPGPQPPPSQPAPAPSPAEFAVRGTVAGGANPARSGFVADYTIAPPLRHRWTARTRAEFLLAEGGRVFEVGPTTLVRARSARTGRVLWSARVADEYYGTEGAAYDAGVVFVQMFDDLIALDAASGRRLWQHKLASVAFAAEPVAAGGVVYAYFSQGGGTLVALHGRTGRVLWSRSAVGGSGGAALDRNRLYLGGACGNAQAVTRASGQTVWNHSTGCSGGGDVRARLHAGRVWLSTEEYTSDGYRPPPVLTASTGRVVDRTPTPPVVFAGGLAFTSTGRVVTAKRVATGRVEWSARSPFTAPIATGRDLFGIVRRLTMVDAASGLLVWSGGRRLESDAFDSDSPAQTIATAGGMVFASGGGRLVAFRSGLRPRAGRVGFGAAPRDVFAGDATVLVGVLGSRLRGGDPPVQIAAAPWRRGRFRGHDSVRSTGGGFRSYARVFRNRRFRATASGSRSRTVTVYAYPHIHLARPRRRGGRVRVRATVTTPRIRLAGRRLYLYIGRGRRARRIAGSRLRGRRGKARTTVSFRPLRRVHRRDRIWVCVRGALRKGLGRPDDMARRCGARRVRLR